MKKNSPENITKTPPYSNPLLRGEIKAIVEEMMNKSLVRRDLGQVILDPKYVDDLELLFTQHLEAREREMIGRLEELPHGVIGGQREDGSLITSVMIDEEKWNDVLSALNRGKQKG